MQQDRSHTVNTRIKNAATVTTQISPARKLIAGVLFIFMMLGLGVAGYMSHGWSFDDSLYMVIITIFSVGYGEVHPVDTPGLRILTSALIVMGCTGMIFVTGALVQFFTFTQFQQIVGTKRMKNDIDHLRAHVIVCGFGRIGNMLARELHAARSPFIVLDRVEKRIAEARELGYLCIQGEATDEAVLVAAGVGRARILATVLPDDAANVFITLSARSLNPQLQIIARGEMPTTEGKLLHAGANQVVLPAHIGAERIAELILHPEASRLIRNAGTTPGFEQDLRGLGLNLEVVTAAGGGVFTGLSIEEIESRARGAFLIIAINREDGSTISRPSPTTRIEPGDGVVVLGRSGQVNALEAFVKEEA